MITDGQKQHYLAVKSFSALLRGITPNHKEDFYYSNCFRSYSTKNRLEKHEKVCNNHDYSYVKMPEKENKILKYNHGEKSMKSPFTIYADLECLLEEMHSCQNNPEKSSTTKINVHTPSGYSYCSFDSVRNKLDCYRGKNCMEKFSKNLKEHATKIINHEKKRNDTANL